MKAQQSVLIALSALLGVVIFALAQPAGVMGQHARTDANETQLTPMPFDTGRAMHHVAVLTSDSLQGRYPGFLGGNRAEKYLEDHFKRIGLEPPFGKTGYRQPFTYPAGDCTMPSYLVVKYPNGKSDSATFWKQMNIYKGSGIGHGTGKIVFVGYGVYAPDKGWNDYDSVDVKGAIVLAMRGTPDFTGVRWNMEGVAGMKAIAAKKYGAVAFLQFDNDPPRLPAIFDTLAQPDFPVLNIAKSFGDSILMKSCGKTSDQLRDEAKKLKKSAAVALTAIGDVRVSGKFYPKRPLANVAGLLPASDPAHRNDIVVVGAHFDHHGMDPAGNIYHGGNDNASGAATVMELAEQFAKSGKKYNQSILFIGYTAEEEGLLGSSYFVKTLSQSGYHVKASLSMDVVGTGGDTLGVGGLAEFPQMGQAIVDSLPESIRKGLQYWRLYPGSDHVPFDEAGIPSFIIGTIGGVYDTYHTPYDTLGNVKASSLGKVGDLAYRFIENAVKIDEKPSWFERFNNDAERINDHFLFKTCGIENYSIQNVIQPFLYRGIRPFYPVKIQPLAMNDDRDNQLGIILDRLASERKRFQQLYYPILADSISKDFPKIDPYRGLMFSVPITIANSMLRFGWKTLNREGVTFIDLPDNYPSDDTLRRLVDQDLKETNIRFIIDSDKPMVSNPKELSKYFAERQKGILRIAGILKEKAIFHLHTEQLDSSLLASLKKLGSFVLTEGSANGSVNINMREEEAEYSYIALRSLLKHNTFDNIGLAGINKYKLESLRTAGFTNFELQNLLYYNFKTFMDGGPGKNAPRGHPGM